MAGPLILMKLTMLRREASGPRSGWVLGGAAAGLALAAGTVDAATLRARSPGTVADLLAVLFAVWTLGWVLGSRRCESAAVHATSLSCYRLQLMSWWGKAEAAHRFHPCGRGGRGAEPAGTGRGISPGRAGGPCYAHPGWLEQRVCVSDFARRYGTPMTSWRPPASQAQRDKLAIAYARDGYALLEATYDPSSPGWLREIPAVDVLRRVLVQNYTRVISADGKEVVRRREKEPEGDGSRPAESGSPLRMTLMPGGVSSGTRSGSGTSCM